MLPAKSQEHLPQGLLPYEIGELSLLSEALKSPLIKKSSVEDLKQVLRLVMMKVGIRAQNLPQDEERAVLIEHIYSHYGGHSIQEIRLAFEMAIGGSLELRPDDIKCYENFSCAYFSSVMNAYRKWSGQQHHLIPTDPGQRIFSAEEIEQSAREMVEIQYQTLIAGRKIYNSEINKAILEKDGLLITNETVEEFYIRRYNAGAKNIYTKIP